MCANIFTLLYLSIFNLVVFHLCAIYLCHIFVCYLYALYLYTKCSCWYELHILHYLIHWFSSHYHFFVTLTSTLIITSSLAPPALPSSLHTDQELELIRRDLNAIAKRHARKPLAAIPPPPPTPSSPHAIENGYVMSYFTTSTIPPDHHGNNNRKWN